MTTFRTTFRLDPSPLTAALAELSAALERLGEISPQARQRIVEFIETGAQVAAFGLDGGAAADADEVTLIAQPGQGLLVLLAAARAGNVDDGVVEKALGHVFTPTVGVSSAPTVTESPAGQKPAGGEGNAKIGDAGEGQ